VIKEQYSKYSDYEVDRFVYVWCIDYLIKQLNEEK